MSSEQEESKRCSKCKEVKPVSEFNKRKDSKDGYRNDCKECVAARKAKYYEANKEKIKAKHAKYRAANRDKLAAYHAEYRAANKDKIAEYQSEYYAANKDKIAAQMAEYARNNPEKFRAASQRRRARKANSKGSFTADQWKERLAYHGYKCVYCGVEKHETPQGWLTMEHLIPLSRGGTNWPSNLAPSCKSCNCSKGTKTHFEFIEYLSNKEN